MSKKQSLCVPFIEYLSNQDERHLGKYPSLSDGSCQTTIYLMIDYRPSGNRKLTMSQASLPIFITDLAIM